MAEHFPLIALLALWNGDVMTNKSEGIKKPQKASKFDQNVEKSSETDSKQQPSFQHEISAFAFEIESLYRANLQTLKVVTSSAKEQVEELSKFIEDRSETTATDGGDTAYKIKPNELKRLEKGTKDLRASSLAIKKIPQIFFCALIHQYDAFLGKLLRVAFYVKPELLNASQKQMTYSELRSYGSLDEACQHLVEKEIESIIRESHADQFVWMEKRFGLSLRKDLLIWSSFIEMTERRNYPRRYSFIVMALYLLNTLQIAERMGLN